MMFVVNWINGEREVTDDYDEIGILLEDDLSLDLEGLFIISLLLSFGMNLLRGNINDYMHFYLNLFKLLSLYSLKNNW